MSNFEVDSSLKEYEGKVRRSLSSQKTAIERSEDRGRANASRVRKDVEERSTLRLKLERGAASVETSSHKTPRALRLCPLTER